MGDAPARDAMREQEQRTRHSRSLEHDPADNADVREHSPNHDLSQASFCVSRRQKFFPCIGALQLICLQRPASRDASRGRRFLGRQWRIIILLAASGTARCQAWCQGCSCPKSRRPRFVLACVLNVLGCATCLDARQFHAETQSLRATVSFIAPLVCADCDTSTGSRLRDCSGSSTIPSPYLSP